MDGQHTHGHGGGLVAVVIVLAVIGAVIHAIWHTLIEVAEIAVWTVLSIAGLAVVAGLGYAAFRIRARVTSRRAAPGAVITGEVIRGSLSADRPAIENHYHVHYHAADSQQAPAITEGK